MKHFLWTSKIALIVCALLLLLTPHNAHVTAQTRDGGFGVITNIESAFDALASTTLPTISEVTVSVPATAAAATTEVLPTEVPSTATHAAPTTLAPSPTNTAPPPTATATHVPPTSTPSPTATATQTPTSTRAPGLKPGNAVRPDNGPLISPYCDMPDMDRPPVIQEGQAFYLNFGWLAYTPQQVQDYLDTAKIEITLDGVPVRSDWANFATPIFSTSTTPYQNGVNWFVPIAPLKRGTHRTTYHIRFTEEIFDGGTYYGPGTGTPEESDSCTFTVSALSQAGAKVYGPQAGSLHHDPSIKLVKDAESDVSPKNFVTEATFFNPYDTSKGTWDFAIFFRSSGPNQQYRLVITSGREWQFGYGNDDNWQISRGTTPNLDTGPTGSNHIRVIATGNSGRFYVNGLFIATLNLDRVQTAGIISVVTGDLLGDELTGASTNYEGFTIWALPDDMADTGQIKSDVERQPLDTLSIPAVKTLVTLEGGAGPVNSVAFSPDRITVAAAYGDGSVRMWNSMTGDLQSVLNAHAQPALCLTFSVDGKWMASGAADGTIRLWQVASDTSNSLLTGHTGGVNSVAFSADGKLLASAGTDGTVRLWDVMTGKNQSVLKGHAGAVNGVAFSPDGKLVASAGADKAIRLWDPATGQTVKTLAGHTGVVNSVQFSPDGHWLASSSLDKTAKLWDVAAGQVQYTLSDHKDAVLSAAFSPDGRLLATSSKDKSIRLWIVKTGSDLGALKDHTDKVLVVVFSPDGTRLASASADKTVRIWAARGW